MTQADFMRIPAIDTPFADNDTRKDFSFLQSGVRREMLIPTSMGGQRFTRHQMNGIGYLATIGAFLDRIGYPYGIERQSSATFGGYPKGAIMMTEDDGIVREYMSQEDNNTNPLPAEPDDGTYEGNEHWKPTLPLGNITFFPDYGSKKLIYEYKTGNEGNVLWNYSLPESGWYYLWRGWRIELGQVDNAYIGADTNYMGSAWRENYEFILRIQASGGDTNIDLSGEYGKETSYLFPGTKGQLISITRNGLSLPYKIYLFNQQG